MSLVPKVKSSTEFGSVSLFIATFWSWSVELGGSFVTYGIVLTAPAQHDVLRGNDFAQISLGQDDAVEVIVR